MNKKEFGCFYFAKGSQNREFCEKIAEPEFKKPSIKKDVQHRLKEIKDIVLASENKQLMQKVKEYSEKDDFFRENRNNLTNLETLLSPICEKNKDTIDNFKKELSSRFLFLKKEGENFVWDELSMLNTNYSALAYVLTKFREKAEDYNASFTQLYNKFFTGNTEKMDLSPFQRLVYNYLEETLDEWQKKTIKETLEGIAETYRRGKIAEDEAVEYLTKFYELIKFSGDFSFADALGVDFILKRGEEYFPLQVKSNYSACYENSRFCGGGCIGKDKNGKWKTCTHGNFDSKAERCKKRNFAKFK